MLLKSIDMRLIEKLRNEPLFTQRLLPDMLNGNVFPSMRSKCVSFDYRGNGLFTYCKDACFITEHSEAPENFQADYKQIKERCARYSGHRVRDMSALYRFSFAAYPCEWYFVLGMDDFLDGWSSHSFELLLMDAKTNRLLFCRAVRYDGLKMEWGAGPRWGTVARLEESRDRIAEQRGAIIDWCTAYTQAMQALTGISLPAPTEVCDDCGLLIYGFDEDQKNGKLKKIMNSLTQMGWPVYAAENIEDVDPETLFKQLAEKC